MFFFQMKCQILTIIQILEENWKGFQETFSKKIKRYSLNTFPIINHHWSKFVDFKLWASSKSYIRTILRATSMMITNTRTTTVCNYLHEICSVPKTNISQIPVQFFNNSVGHFSVGYHHWSSKSCSFLLGMQYISSWR